MKICFACDLHLSNIEDTLQYDVFDFVLSDVQKERPDCIIYAGDVTCDGNIEVYKSFVSRASSLGMPFLFVPGNSDLRDARYRDEIKKLSSPILTVICGKKIFAVNDCEAIISDSDLEALESADKDSIVFMHHPIISLKDGSDGKFLAWRTSHPDTMLFYGHKHKPMREGRTVSLQALDPDKAIGSNPCLTYYDTDTDELTSSYYVSKVPADLHNRLGISCYKVREHIALATKNKLKSLELRPSCITMNESELDSLIKKWREAGGENLSIHIPDISYADGRAIPDENLGKYIELANKLGVNRFTQHVPKASVQLVRSDSSALSKMAECLASYFSALDHEVVIGIENMHMTKNDSLDGERRFGYTPEECIEFMEILSTKTSCKVGINFDIGHARNNHPFSWTNQISTWFAKLGKYIVGYHLHQVNGDPGKNIENHIAFDSIYGRLISLCSFFKCWETGRINKAPVVFEMRPAGAYEQTLALFNSYKLRNSLEDMRNENNENR